MLGYELMKVTFIFLIVFSKFLNAKIPFPGPVGPSTTSAFKKPQECEYSFEVLINVNICLAEFYHVI